MADEKEKYPRLIEILRDVGPHLVAGAPVAKAGEVIEVDYYMAGVLVASGYGKSA